MQKLCEKTSTLSFGYTMTDKETQIAKEAFLQDYATSGTILHACRVANVHRTTVYRWLEKDEKFSLQYRQTQQDFADAVLGEVINRAIEGYYQPVVSMGKIVYQANGEPLMERVVSDKLLTILRHHGMIPNIEKTIKWKEQKTRIPMKS
jgi:hypothetical protein